MSKCDDDIIFEAYKNYKQPVVREGFDYFEDNEELTGSETKSFETPKTKMTEDEAKEFFANSDCYHQSFHDFMKEAGYAEKEIDGEEMWCKCKKSKAVDEDEQQVVPNQQPAAGTVGQQTQQAQNQQQPVQGQNAQNQQANTQQQTQEIVNSLSRMTPDQINQVYQAIFG